MEDWERVKLGDVIKLDTGYPFKSKSFTEKEEDIPLVKGSNLQQGYIDWDEAKKWPKEEFEKYKDYELKEGDVILAMDRPWVSAGLKYSWIKNSDPKSLLVQRIARLRANGQLHQDFLRYLIASRDFTDYIKPIVTGVNVPHISPDQIKSFEFNLPSLSVQKEVASILSPFDDLIENNTRRIEILEEMARRIYREWFVHFRYPGHEQDKLVDSGTELGEIPEGWEVKTMKNIIERSSEGLKPIDYPAEEFYYYSFSAFDEGQRPERIKGKSIKSRKYILRENAVLISKLNPRIPRVWYCKPQKDKRSLASTEFLILKGVEGVSNGLLYSLLTSQSFYGRFQSLTGGTSTSHQRVKPKDFRNMKMVLPKKELLTQFQVKVGQIFDLVHNLNTKNEKLKSTRDLLLPELISGKIKIQQINSREGVL